MLNKNRSLRGGGFYLCLLYMPYVMRKIKNKNLYSVKNLLTGEFHSYGSSKKNAEAQIRMLYMLENKKLKK